MSTSRGSCGAYETVTRYRQGSAGVAIRFREPTRWLAAHLFEYTALCTGRLHLNVDVVPLVPDLPVLGLGDSDLAR